MSVDEMDTWILDALGSDAAPAWHPRAQCSVRRELRRPETRRKGAQQAEHSALALALAAEWKQAVRREAGVAGVFNRKRKGGNVQPQAWRETAYREIAWRVLARLPKKHAASSWLN